jgi:hypothetical protein
MTASPMLDGLDELRATVATADAVAPAGARTHWEVGNPAAGGVEVRAPGGIVAYDPAELTVTAGAGTTVAELESTPDRNALSIRAIRVRPWAVSWRPDYRDRAGCATDRCATVC